jgi:hypothetical protein
MHPEPKLDPDSADEIPCYYCHGEPPCDLCDSTGYLTREEMFREAKERREEDKQERRREYYHE